MAGLRLAAPLQALREGHSAWAVGVLLALFAAAPVLLGAARRPPGRPPGYHRPVHLAVALDGAAAACCAVASTFAGAAAGTSRCLCGAAMATGTGANIGLLDDPAQRRPGRGKQHRARAHLQLAGHGAVARQRDRAGGGGLHDRRRRLRAPPMRCCCCCRWPRWSSARQVPRERAGARQARAATGRTAWDLLRAPGLQAAAAGELAAVGVLGRAHLRGADPRPRARLQRQHHRPGPGRLHAVGDGGAGC